MKSDEILQRLSQNPFYKMTDEEAKRVKELESAANTSSVTEDSKKKQQQVVKGNATVKETGKVKKHASDPVSE